MMIQLQLLSMMLGTLSFQELRDVHGLTQLELPWVLIELVIWAMICRRAADFEVPPDVMCMSSLQDQRDHRRLQRRFLNLVSMPLLLMFSEACRTPLVLMNVFMDGFVKLID